MPLPDEKDLFKPGMNPHKEAETEVEESDVEVDLSEGDDVELEVVDDTPAEDRNRKPLPESEAEPTEEEMEAYSEAVQKRIRKETHRYHDERRAREAAERQLNEAATLTKRLLDEKKALQTQYSMGETAFISQSKEKATLAMEAAKRAYKEAYEIGDADAMANAQEKMADIASERREAANWERQALQRQQKAGQEEEPVVQSQPSQPVQSSEDIAAAQRWAKDNTWFGTDPEMTQFAYGAHDAIKAKGIDPLYDSAEYYSRLNARMREVFPNYGWKDPAPKKKTTVNSVVAPVNRTTNKAKRVTLTQSQLSLAKRLGLTPIQYAQEVAKLEAK